MRTKPLKIYFDGGCRPNPGMMETGVVAQGVFYHKGDTGYGNGHEAEWLALLDALAIARLLDARNVVLIGDCASVIYQAQGLWPCRNAEMQRYYAKLAVLQKDFDRITLRHVRRSRNLAGIALENNRSGSKIIRDRRGSPILSGLP
jgi:ribonuclease HI